jgi:Putative peptidoglycan binding domain
LPPAPPASAQKTDPSATAADYLRHVRDAARYAAALDYFARDPALMGDVLGLMNAPEESVQALLALQAPMDVITVQRDLNVLGCSPPLGETGVLDAPTTEAVKALQSKFGQVPTGDIDSDARVAIRYSVGSIS